MTITTRRVAVIIASLGRPRELQELAYSLAQQTLYPEATIYSVTELQDLPQAWRTAPNANAIFGPKGLSAQRNRGMEAALADCDIIAFFDDDYLPSRFALEGIASFFSAHSDVVGINGHLLADGIAGPGIRFDAAAAIIAEHDAQPRQPIKIKQDLSGLYGCNMAIRTAAIGDLRFDENLPLYGWQEDIDFTARLRPRGRLVSTNAFAGVHRGVKTSRTSGVRFGYSQIVNQVYLARKGTVQWRPVLYTILGHLITNHIRALRPEPWVDRWGRVKGNWIALKHLTLGIADPRYILEL